MVETSISTVGMLNGVLSDLMIAGRVWSGWLAVEASMNFIEVILTISLSLVNIKWLNLSLSIGFMVPHNGRNDKDFIYIVSAKCKPDYKLLLRNQRLGFVSFEVGGGGSKDPGLIVVSLSHSR